MKLFLLLSLFLQVFASVVGQHKTIIKYGLSPLSVKYNLTTYENNYVLLNDVGSIPVKNTISNSNFRQDIDFFYIIDKNKFIIQWLLGYDVYRYKLNTTLYYSGTNHYDLYYQNTAIVGGFSGGVKFIRNKSVQGYILIGPEIQIIRFRYDYYPINYALEAYYKSQADIPFYSANTYYLLKTYRIPDMALTSSINFQIYSIISTLKLSYYDDNLSIRSLFANSKPSLFSSCLIFKLQFSYIFKYSYK